MDSFQGFCIRLTQSRCLISRRIQFQGFMDQKETRVGNMTLVRQAFANKTQVFNGISMFYVRWSLASAFQLSVFKAAESNKNK